MTVSSPVFINWSIRTALLLKAPTPAIMAIMAKTAVTMAINLLLIDIKTPPIHSKSKGKTHPFCIVPNKITVCIVCTII